MSAETNGPAGPPMGAIWYSNPRERERGKFGPCLQMGRRPASSHNRDRMSLPTGRPNEALPGHDGGFRTHEVGWLKFVFALGTEAHVNCQRRKKKKDAETYARQNSFRYLGRDPRSERGL